MLCTSGAYASDNAQNPNKNYTPGTLKISFDFSRGGIASSQYAIWIENSRGQLVRTVYVTKYTADGGYLKRIDCLPTWVYKANPENFSIEHIDAFTGPTPKKGEQIYTWNGTNDKGEMLPQGEYKFYVECSLHWDHGVLYGGKVTLGGEAQESIQIDEEYYTDSKKNNGIIKNLKVSYIP
jgi:hypothetical protein